jgi:serine/threonine protein kinase
MASEHELAATLQESPRATAESPRDPSALPRGTTIHRYVLIDKIGEGGMGVVYAAYDQVLHRRVAVKLVTSRADQEGQARLLAEARAMAQLHHAAIVPIHDVGEFAGQIFLAMAFIDGSTLRKWQTGERRTWQDIVAIYRQVGEGLVFAHEQGIVHRDFKPDNVLVDEDGRAHITDFGLAKIFPSPFADEPPDTIPDSAKTIAGTVAGTPGYMSPEQARGDPTDARTDQYAFCASLFEALHRALPHDEPPMRTDVPRALLAAIERGLAAEPRKRWPSMRALLDDLALRAPGRRRRLAIAGGLALVPVALAAWLMLRGRGGHDACDVPAARTMWQASRQQVITELQRSGTPSDELVAALDAWTADWTEMAQASCRATAAGSQSEQLLDLRSRCLDHALDIATSVVQLASHRDAELPGQPGARAPSLPDLEACADSPGLLGAMPMPEESLRADVITALSKQIATIEALYDVESYQAARERIDQISGPIHAVHYDPLTFELYMVRSSIEMALEADPVAAANAAWSALAVDPAGRNYQVAAVWVDLVWIVGELQHAPAHAIELGQVAQAVADRVGDRHQHALLDQRLATMLSEVGKLDEAQTRFERARAAYRELHDPGNEIAVLQGEAIVAAARGDTAGRLKLLEDAAVLAERMPHAPLLLANELSSLGVAYTDAGRYQEAHIVFERALKVIGDAHDDRSMLVGIHINVGLLAEHEEDILGAQREYQAALEVARASLAPDASETQLAWFDVGQIENQRRAFAEGAAALHHAQDILQHLSHDAVLSGAYVGAGLIARQLVTAHLGLGRPADALASAEECLAFAQREGGESGVLADIHFALAQSAWAAGDHTRARTTMRLAIAEYQQAGVASGDASTWLAAH